MASTRPLLIPLLLIFTSSSLPLTTLGLDQPSLPTSTISAAPALLPESPSTAPPALSPDISPLFPSPGGSELSPSESSFPIIPSSPSPPNPDATAAPGPFVAFSPFGSLPFSSSVPIHASMFLSSAVVPGLLAFWLMLQLSGV